MAACHVHFYLSISRLEKKEGELQEERERCRSLEAQVCAITLSNFIMPYLFRPFVSNDLYCVGIICLSLVWWTYYRICIWLLLFLSNVVIF